MTMRRAPVARPASSVPLQHPQWNGSSKIKTPLSGSGNDRSSAVAPVTDSRQHSRSRSGNRSAAPQHPHQRLEQSTRQSQKDTGGGASPVSGASTAFGYGSMQSPDAFELVRVHNNMGSHSSLQPATGGEAAVGVSSIFQSFLQTSGDGVGPVVPDWAEAQCSSSSLDDDTDTQLHQLQLRLAATRDLLRASAQTKASAQEARRKAEKGQIGSGGLLRYSVRPDIGRKVAAAASERDDASTDSAGWAPPKLDLRFPWDGEEADAGGAQRSTPAIPQAMAGQNEEPSSYRLQGAYHRYFGHGKASSQPIPSSGTSTEKRAPHTVDERSRDGTQRSQTGKSQVGEGFNAERYARSILRRRESDDHHLPPQRNGPAADFHHREHKGEPDAPQSHRRFSALLSPPRDDDQRNNNGVKEVAEKYFDDDGSVAISLDRSMPLHHSLSGPIRLGGDDLVDTPRGRGGSATHASQLKREDARVDSGREHRTASPAQRSSSVWSTSVSAVLESINFANSANPVMLSTTLLSGLTHNHGGRSASIADEGSFLMSRDILSMLQH